MFSNFGFWPWWFLAELPDAKGGTGPSLVWAVGNTEYDGGAIMRWQDLTAWNSSAGTKAVLSPETMTLPPIRTGDILALPRTTPAYEGAHRGMVGMTFGDKLLVLTPGLDQPLAVNPAAPVLPAAVLAGLGPYVTWSGWLLGRELPTQYASQFRSDLPGEPPRVFDLRSGKLVDIAVKDPRTPEDWLASAALSMRAMSSNCRLSPGVSCPVDHPPGGLLNNEATATRTRWPARYCVLGRAALPFALPAFWPRARRSCPRPEGTRHGVTIQQPAR